MYTHGFLQRKYVYPSLLLLFLLMLFWKFALAHAAEGAPLMPRAEAGRADAELRSFGHAERDLVDAADRFNAMMSDASGQNRFAGRTDSFEERLRRQEAAYDTLRDRSRDSVAGYYDNRAEEERERLSDVNDGRYQTARRQLNERRNTDSDIYRDHRRQLEGRLSTASRTSPEYDRLERELNDLDRRHAERERNYERDFRNMDADYSIARW